MKKEVKNKKSSAKKVTFDQLKTRQSLLILLLVLVVVGTCAGFTFVWIKMNERELKEELKLGSIEIIVDDTNSSSIVMDDPYPMTEEGGLSREPYKFFLKNTGMYKINYSLNLVDDVDAIAKCAEENNGIACKTVNIDTIRYSMKKDGNVLSTGLLKDSKGVIDMGIIAPIGDESTGIVNYELKLWVDYNTPDNMEGAKFYGKIDVRVQTEES